MQQKIVPWLARHLVVLQTHTSRLRLIVDEGTPVRNGVSDDINDEGSCAVWNARQELENGILKNEDFS